MLDVSYEVHTSVVTRHIISREDEEPLIEEKTDTIVSRLGTGHVIKKYQHLTRRIGKEYVVSQKTEAGEEVHETTMTEQELKEFNAVWEKEWCPKIEDELKAGVRDSKIGAESSVGVTKIK